MLRIIMAFWLTILLTSCATTTANYYSQTVQSWRGSDAQSLVKRWGRPDNLLAAPNGRTFYVYKTESYHNAGTPASPSIGVNVSRDGRPVLTSSPEMNMTWNRGGMSLNCLAIFIVDKNGRIVDTETQGTGCIGSSRFANRMQNPSNPVPTQS